VSRYGFIAAEQAHYPIAVLCRVLRVARAGYSAWLRRDPSRRAAAAITMTADLVREHERSRRTDGAPRLHAALRAAGTRVSRKRIARLMRQAQLRGVARGRAVPRTTRADPAAVPAPNLLQRDFTATASDLCWVGDITYWPTGEGWLYLATLLDVYARRVVGFALADYLRTELALEALHLALGQRHPPPNKLVHHTDRGCQYTAHAYQAVLVQHGITPSMSRRGDCYDNALAESFNGTLKSALVARTHWPTRQEARVAVCAWITVFYTRQRRHSSLGYQTPVQFENSPEHRHAA
jgi:putative transposase